MQSRPTATNAAAAAPLHPHPLQVGGNIFMINHFEYPQPAAVYLSTLTVADNGDLSVINTAHVPDNSSHVQGLWFMCRGEKTPWGTHLGAEEYPPDCELCAACFYCCCVLCLRSRQTRTALQCVQMPSAGRLLQCWLL
jgi:hypothetical protein